MYINILFCFIFSVSLLKFWHAEYENYITCIINSARENQTCWQFIQANISAYELHATRIILS